MFIENHFAKEILINVLRTFLASHSKLVCVYANFSFSHDLIEIHRV